jgi:predicted RNA-binding Zn-ribbon protein involved in translation (DUF1610 family)
VPEHEPQDYDECAICGRSILRGENAVEFATPEGGTMLVCSLCGERAESVGWVRTDLLPEGRMPAEPPRRNLFGLRLRERFSRARGESTPAPPDPEPEPEPESEAIQDTPEGRLRRSVERFNEGEAPRLVAGLTRSLGEPRAAVRELQGPDRVEVTIAWELSWYRWELGRSGSGEARQVAKGAEVEELDDDELDWNAEVNEEGFLRWRGGS